MTEISLHEKQSEVIRDLFVDHTCRYSVVNASRGFGKSYLAASTAKKRKETKAGKQYSAQPKRK